MAERRDAATRDQWPEVAVRQWPVRRVDGDNGNRDLVQQELTYGQTALVAGRDHDNGATHHGPIQRCRQSSVGLTIAAKDSKTEIY